MYAVGGWTDGYTNAIPRLLAHLTVPRKGLIGPWAHGYPHVALPGPQIGFLQEALRWWDHWLKGIDTGVMNEPMLRAWMTESARPTPYHETLPGRWIAESSSRRLNSSPRRLHFTDLGLQPDQGALTPIPICSPHTVGERSGSWCPFGTRPDQAGDQRPDDERSLAFDTAVLDETIELLGAPVVTLDITSDRPLANLVVRLCDVHPDGASLRVSYGILNLTHRDGHAAPAPLVPGQRYTVRIQLNDLGSVIPCGHRIRLALSTTYWPMIWPPPENATVTVFAGALDLPTRPVRADHATLPALAAPETASPEKTTAVAPGVVRVDRLGLELGTDGEFHCHITGDDPLSAVVETRQTQTIARDAWRVRIETHTRISCTRDRFRLHATMRAWEGDAAVCAREWNDDIPRD